MDQPPPVKNNNTPIVDLVVQDMLERKRLGIERYGVALQANNGRDALRDAYEEALDMAIYLKQALEEQEANIEVFLAEHDENVRLHTELEKLLEERNG